MHFTLLALVAPILARVAIAISTPVGITSVKEAPVNDLSPLNSAHFVENAHFIQTNKPLPITGSTTSPNSAFHALSADFNEMLFICNQQSCAGLCYSYDLSSLVGGCYQAFMGYESIMVFSASGRSLPYRIYASLVECGLPAMIPTVNACYDVFYDGAPFEFPYFNKS
jgi:hypothetical protein